MSQALQNFQRQLHDITQSNEVLRILSNHYYKFVKTDFGNITQGFIRGFIIYFIPMSALRRGIKIITLKRAIAIGGFAATTRTINILLNKPPIRKLLLQYLSKIGIRKENYLQFRAAMGGAFGAIVAGLLDRSLINSVFVLWCLTRGIPIFLPNIPYGSTIVMCLAAAQIGTTWVRRPLEIDQGYRKFLVAQGGKSAYVLEILGTQDFPSRLHCAVSHPGQSCTMHAITYCIGAFWRAFKLYLPLAIAFFILSKKKSIKNSFIGLIRSCLFLAGYCAGAWVVLCVVFRRPFTNNTHVINSMALWSRLWISGLPVLIELPGRRKELAQYCATYAIDTIYRNFVALRLAQPSDFYGFCLLSFAWLLLLWNFKTQPKFVSSWVLGLKEPPKEEVEVPNQIEEKKN